MQKSSNAVELLTADHRAIAALFAAFDVLSTSGAPQPDKAAAASAICVALSVHAQIEEEIFYPALRAGAIGAAMIDEVEVEHLLAKDLIAQISGMQPNDALYDARVRVLRESNDQHGAREESALFPRARRSGLDLTTLGAAMAARKLQLLTEYRVLAGDRPRFDAAGDAVGRRALAHRGAPVGAGMAA